MTSLAARLPLPRNVTTHLNASASSSSSSTSTPTSAPKATTSALSQKRDAAHRQPTSQSLTVRKAGPPPYGQRQGFLPKNPEVPLRSTTLSNLNFLTDSN